MSTKFIDFTNRTFTRLTAINRAENDKTGHVQWNCVCTCGNKVVVPAKSLKTGNNKSCGCLKKELDKTRGITHGLSKTPEYHAWDNIKGRCYNINDKRFSDYGGRGITVCEEWKNDFLAFYNCVGPRPSKKHSIDRIDNDGDYRQGNVKWSTAKEQQNNTRQNHYITVNGKTLNIAQWSILVGIHRGTLNHRLTKGWSDYDAVFTPVRDDKHNITINGNTMTPNQWAEQVGGITAHNIRTRLLLGWPPEKAVFHPVRKR